MRLLKQFKKPAKIAVKVLLLSFLCPVIPAFAWTLSARQARVENSTRQNQPLQILLIQEVHVQYEAQQAIADILRGILQKEEARLVFVEGGWGDMSLSYLRDYGSPAGRRQVADQYLRDGRISGEEYLDLTSSISFDLWGIEDEALYRKNLEAFLEIQQIQTNLLHETGRLESLMEVLAPGILKAEALEFFQKSSAYHRGQLPLDGFALFLRGKMSGRFSSEIFPEMEKLIKLLESPGQPDPAAVQLEKNELVRALSSRMDRIEFETLNLESRPANAVREVEALEALLAAANRHLGAGARTARLEKHLETLRKTLAFNSSGLFSELAAFEAQAAAQLAQSEDEKKFLAVAAALRDLRGLFELKIGPAEFERFEKNPVSILEWKNFLEASAARINGPAPAIQFDLMEKALPLCISFYQIARERETAMARIVIEKMKRENQATAVVIAGGFHAAPLKAMLEAQGAAVTLASPNFEAPGGFEGQHRRYFEVLKEKWQGAAGSVRSPAIERGSPAGRPAAVVSKGRI